MIRRTIKISLAILALVVIALLVAPWFINVDHYKPRIAKAIEDATGRRWQESVNPIEVEAAIADLRDRRGAYESAAAQDTLESLAQPSAETCRWCPYRLLCRPYWGL